MPPIGRAWEPDQLENWHQRFPVEALAAGQALEPDRLENLVRNVLDWGAYPATL